MVVVWGGGGVELGVEGGGRKSGLTDEDGTTVLLFRN